MELTVFFLGMTLLQVIFITYQYILFKRREFLYYLLYTFCVGIFICFKAFPNYNPLPHMVIPGEPFTAARSVLLTGFAMYYKFGRYFTETPRLYPQLNRQVKFAEWILIGFSVIDIPLLLYGLPFHVLEPISRAIYLVAMPFSIYVIIFLITRRRRLTSILVIGSSLLLFFASASFVQRIFITPNIHPESYYLAYVELGIFFEFLFLNYGLIYKTRMIQKENMRLEVEKQVELYKQRMRISNHLHDEVGATLSGLAMYSQLTREQMLQHQTSQVEHSLSVMQHSAADMVDKLSDIVWSVNPEHDTLQNLLQKLDDYAKEMGSAKNIRVQTTISHCMEEARLSMEDRRNIYLLCKEAVNNAVKYSQCTELFINVESSQQHIRIEVRDNGHGFDLQQPSQGNGIRSMHHRARELKACLQMESSCEKGTRICLEYNLPQ